MSNLRSSWQVATAAGEPHSIIHVRNLQAVVEVGTDAWGRSGKLQPVLLSATVALREPFETASVEDSVNKSTIHYGVLSKAILAAANNQAARGTLMELYEYVSDYLYTWNRSTTGAQDGIPVIDVTLARSLSVEILLPKASLLGSGISLSGTNLFNADGSIEMYCMGMKVHDLRIPTLIGVNSNERLAKQIVVANVEIDRWETVSDKYVQFEELVVKTIEESSFQTLEALGMHLGHRLVKHFVIPEFSVGGSYPRFKISLAKPTAVTFADAPTVEILVDSNPAINKSLEKLWQNEKDAKAPPFPLQGRLDLWIRENCVSDITP